ncbi:metal ABC transporter permease [Candidatus Puniceispirillum sp.]|nr:metal ABC transporter permease [Candidatus Puniceispirillum sp.]
MIETLLLPFKFHFMQNAFLIGLTVAVPTALLSCFLVVRGWSLMGDAISHAVLPGVVLAYILNIPLMIGAFIAGIFCALATGYLSENCRVKHDTVMGVVFSGMFAAGLVMYTKIETDVHLDHILFGNMLGVSVEDIKITVLIAMGVSSFLLMKWSDLVLESFDPLQARASGLNVYVLKFLLLASISLTVVATLKATGLILAVALLIAPGSIAFLITNQFRLMMPFAIILTMLTVVFGIYLSFWIDSAPAPTVIMLLTLVFVFVFIRKIRSQKAIINSEMI